ncbi:twin-arginine translocase TatA/TatE family subunit [Mucilaginibacter sp. RS28]|uniref:Sec-independent protein translocase protein TatA n=1 Tax=Mucilaginibacter straminoryzae TaxID=2932774 RepID=A0A9X2BCA3_9SPHI|nr:twin-arginine translocase TatA/TatE family subunit [Mucilaginibacter straminoryzae]MCJ8210692.1 twin-arginine translocase TatA/TatE family subunit [Mucilaginibacter straminoryzae]
MFHPVLLFLNIGTPELILILFVALLLFGGEKLPQMARTLGKGLRDFKDASEGVKREIQNQINNFEEKNETPPPVQQEPEAPSVPNAVPLSGANYMGITDYNHPEPSESHADVSHLIPEQTETTPAAENHAAAANVHQEEEITKQGTETKAVKE